MVGLLLKSHRVDPDTPDSCGRTPLSFAAFGGHEDVVNVLLGSGDVNPNSPDFQWPSTLVICYHDETRGGEAIPGNQKLQFPIVGSP